MELPRILDAARHEQRVIPKLHTRFRSAILGEARTLAVLLPPEYEREPLRRYPVLYMQDGQNLFPTTSQLGKSWQLDEIVPALIADGAVEPLIIAGIFHAGERRIDELTPTADRKQKRGGGGDKYERMLLEEVMPFIGARYRTRIGPGNTGIGGSSLGGLLSLWTALRHPDVFGRVAALSPSAWWDRRRLVRDVRGIDRLPDIRVWLSVGTSEGRSGAPVVRALRDAMIESGWVLGRDLRYHEERSGSHDEHAWGAVLEPCLRFLFPMRADEPADLGGLERL